MVKSVSFGKGKDVKSYFVYRWSNADSYWIIVHCEIVHCGIIACIKNGMDKEYKECMWLYVGVLIPILALLIFGLTYFEMLVPMAVQRDMLYRVYKGCVYENIYDQRFNVNMGWKQSIIRQI